MKLLKFASVFLFSIALFSCNVLAAQDLKLTAQDSLEHSKISFEKKGLSKQEFEKFREELKSNPVKALEDRKAKIESAVKEGKLPKEKADKMIEHINKTISSVKEFDKLSVAQKKEKLKKDFNEAIEKKIEKGRIDKDKADALIKDFGNKIDKWDGKGYPQFDFRGPKGIKN